VDAIKDCSHDPLLETPNHSLLLIEYTDQRYDTEHIYRRANIWQDEHRSSGPYIFHNYI
jgi:hypothetical protein